MRSKQIRYENLSTTIIGNLEDKSLFEVTSDLIDYIENLSLINFDLTVNSFSNVDTITFSNKFTVTSGVNVDFIEQDPVFTASPASSITNTKISNWDDAFSWGDHSLQNYLASTNTYNNPSWLNTLSWSKITGAPSFLTAADKGQPLGIAPLNASGKIDSTYLPSYVDDVLEYSTISSFPVTGEQGKIYVAVDTGKGYRWSGSIYIEIFNTGGGGGASAFTDLSDVPSTYSGHSLKIVRVKADESGLEFATISSGGITSLNGLTGGTQTFANDTNVTIVSSGTAHTITWSGTLADGRIASASTWNAKQNALNGTGLVKSTSGTISYITDNSSNWDTAFGWGNHASAGYITSLSSVVPTSRNITINGDTKDLSADRSWTVSATVADGDYGDISISGGVWSIDNSTVTIAKINATGSPDSNTYLRGDGTWFTPAGGGDMLLGTSQIVTATKTFAHNTFLLRNSGATFSTTITTGATANRTWNIPELGVGGTFAALEGSQTFTGSKTFSAQVTLNATGSATAAQLVFAGATSNWINMGTTGVGAPVLVAANRSVGTKIVLNNSLAPTQLDAAIGYQVTGGIGTWFSTPLAQSSTNGFRFYGASATSTVDQLLFIGGNVAGGGLQPILASSTVVQSNSIATAIFQNIYSFGNSVLNPPVVNTVSGARSTGTKVVLWANTTANDCDISLGANTNTLWFTAGNVTSGGTFTFNNPAATGGGVLTTLATISRTGLNLGLSTSVFQINGTQVLGARITNWGAPTGTLQRTALSDSSTTTDVLRTLQALVTDLRTHGLIGN
jgi:hypothetical protein